jgi:hypothetical protein
MVISGGGGFGGRSFYADGGTIRVRPKVTLEKENVRDRISLGFPLAILDEFAGIDAKQLADYLSCPVRAAAPELLEALENVSDDLEAELKHRWGYHPALQSKFDRDMVPVIEARELIAKIRGKQ